MFNPGMVGGGQAYVRVEADDSMGMPFGLYSAGSPGSGESGGHAGGGQTGMSVIIYWSYSGGIMDSNLWEIDGTGVIYDPNSIENTNQQIAAAAKGKKLNRLLFGPIGDCVVLD